MFLSPAQHGSSGSLQNIFAQLKDLNLEGYVSQQDKELWSGGATCDVFRAWSARHNKRVAVKRIRHFLLEDISFANSLGREIRLWSRLKHENVLPLLGFFLEGPSSLINIVSEWMVEGTLVEYIKHRNLDILEVCILVRGIASGLNYIHVDHSMIHADLKGRNILISSNGTPLIADFGLFVSTSSSSLAATALHGEKGSARWMARELHAEEFNTYLVPSHSQMTDMWSFGMVISELFRREIPYSSLADRHVPAAIRQGYLPGEPEFCKASGNDAFHNIWTIAEECWGVVPEGRPSAIQVVKRIDSLFAGLNTRNAARDQEILQLKDQLRVREQEEQNMLDNRSREDVSPFLPPPLPPTPFLPPARFFEGVLGL